MVLRGYCCTVYYLNISQSIIGNVDVLEKLLCRALEVLQCGRWLGYRRLYASFNESFESVVGAKVGTGGTWGNIADETGSGFHAGTVLGTNVAFGCSIQGDF